MSNAFKKENVSFILDFFLADCIFYQSAALPPLAAPAQTWKPTTAKPSTLASTAAAASAHLGSALLVALNQLARLDSGRSLQFALQKAVAVKVSCGN